MAHSINGGGVDPVNAEVECAVDRGDRRFVVLLAPTKFPAGTTDGPGAKADWRDEQIGVTESLRFHLNLRNRFRFHVLSFHRVDIVCAKLCRTGGAERNGATG